MFCLGRFLIYSINIPTDALRKIKTAFMKSALHVVYIKAQLMEELFDFIFV